MLSQKHTQSVFNYWKNSLQYTNSDFIAESVALVSHGKDFSDYHGTFILFIEGKTIITAPKWSIEQIRKHISNGNDCIKNVITDLQSPEQTLNQTFNQKYDQTFVMIRDCFEPWIQKTIGPAYYGYLDSIDTQILEEKPVILPDNVRNDCSNPKIKCQFIPFENRRELTDFVNEVDPNDWDSSGLNIESTDPLFGISVNGKYVALSGYKIWGEILGHIGIVCHQNFRGRGYGKKVLKVAAIHAIDHGLIAQYRTLRSNVSSIRIASQLGFQDLATSIAIRFKPEYANL